MTLIIFKYCLPILLGYTLFVGLSGRYNPLIRPNQLAQRPSWFLGVWTGASVAITMCIGLHRAYQMSINNLSALLIPGALILGGALTTGFVSYLWYRGLVNRQITTDINHSASEKSALEISQEFDDTMVLETSGVDTLINIEMDKTQPIEAPQFADINDQTYIWANLSELSDQTLEHEEAQLFDISPARFDEPVLIEANEADSVDLAAQPIWDMSSEPVLIETSETDSADLAAQPIWDVSSEPALVETLENDSVDLKAQPISGVETKILTLEIEAPMPSGTESAISSKAHAHNTLELTNLMVEMKNLRESLEEETQIRNEVENHLRIARKGLAEANSESRDLESKKAVALTQLERELEDKVKRTAVAEARAEREANKCVELENEMVLLRQDTLKATKDSRESVEAGARALSAASKATTFAKDAMTVRTQLEAQVLDATEQLKLNQNTINSLVKELDKEKARTETEVASLAKQRMMHEKQLQAQSDLDEVFQNSDQTFSSRLVRKVAKSRS